MPINASRGFTLVELSIVLVIIGLLVGGILAGRSLIQAAAKKAQIEQNSQVISAVLTFRDKYFQLPGDMYNANKFFSAATQPDQVSNGNGDGVICITSTGCPAPAPATAPWQGYGYCSGIHRREYALLFEHLVAAGLYNFSTYDECNNTLEIGVNVPILKYDPSMAMIIGYEQGQGYIHDRHKIRWGFIANGFVGLYPQDAWEFDMKMDDGAPDTGKFYVTGQRYIYRVPGAPSDEVTNACIYSGKYNLAGNANASNRVCYIDIDAPF